MNCIELLFTVNVAADLFRISFRITAVITGSLSSQYRFLSRYSTLLFMDLRIIHSMLYNPSSIRVSLCYSLCFFKT